MKITDSIHALRCDFTLWGEPGEFIPRSVFIYILLGERVCLVDTGVAQSTPLIYRALKELGREPMDVELVINTHSHADHTGGNEGVRYHSGAIFCAHPLEKLWIEDYEVQYRHRPTAVFHSLVGSPVRVERELREGELLDLGGLELRVLHTPGHSPGSISIELPGQGALIAGDAVPLPGGLPIYEDVPTLMRSLRRLKSLPELKLLLSAWHPLERRHKPYALLDEGMGYVEKIHGAVAEALEKEGEEVDGKRLTEVTFERLGLRGMRAMPLAVRSIEGHRKALREVGREI